MPHIQLTKISSIASPDAVWIARDLRQVKEVCRLLNTEDTVWTSEQMDALGRLQFAEGSAYFHNRGQEISLVYPDAAAPAPQPDVAALALFMDAYVKWNDREDGGEDDLHYAYKVAREGNPPVVPDLVLNTLKGCLSYLETPGDLSPEEVRYLQEDVEQSVRLLCPGYFDDADCQAPVADLPRPYLIQSIQTPQEFWSNNLGWVSVDIADRFTGYLLTSPEEGRNALLKTEDGAELALPLGGVWVPVAEPRRDPLGHFDSTEQIEILEIARVALANADLFDHMVDKLDLSDDAMIELRDKVTLCMESETNTPQCPR